MPTQSPQLKTRVLALVLVCSLFLVSCGEQPPPPPGVSITTIDQSDVTDIMLALEDNFGLKEVLVSQSGATVTVRLKAPTISGEELHSGLAQVLAYLDDRLPSEIQKVDLVFALNHVDSAIISTDRNDIRDWKEKKINNTDFINKMKKTSLL